LVEQLIAAEYIERFNIEIQKLGAGRIKAKLDLIKEEYYFK
jgi:hypothetical protein